MLVADQVISMENSCCTRWKSIRRLLWDNLCILQILLEKNLPQDLETHFANKCSEIPANTRQLFLNRLAAKAEENVTNLTAKKWKLNNDASIQTQYI